MDITLAYGKATLTVTVPDGVHVDTFGSRRSGGNLTRDVFLHRFRQSGADRVMLSSSPLIIVNDGYRHTPTALILRWLDGEFPGALDRASYLVATGAHGAPTDEHFRLIFDKLYDRLHGQVRVHDCRDRDSMVLVGRDRFGCDVLLNKTVLEHDDVLVIGSVEPHYFAGFTGGRKSLFPGLCDLATIERNHNLANSLEARPLRLSGNPVAEHFDELMSLLADRTFHAIQVVADADRIVHDVSCGEIHDAFARAVAAARTVYACEASAPYDLVLCEMRPPLDSNLYQVQKGLENCQAAVRSGGAAVLASVCAEGVGSEDFFRQALTWDRIRNCPYDGVLRFGSHKLSRVITMSQRIDIRLLSQLPHQDVRQVFYEPIDDLNTYLTERRASYDLDRLAVVYDAGHTVLTVKDN